MTAEQIKTKIRSYQFIPEELKDILESIVDYGAALFGDIETLQQDLGSLDGRVEDLEDPQPYIVIASENKTWRQVVSDLGVSTIINNDPLTYLAAIDSEMVEVGTEFDIDITQAVDTEAVWLNGDTATIVTSDVEGDVFDGDTTFTNGVGAVPITLTDIGFQSLSIDLADGLFDPTVILVTVVDPTTCLVEASTITPEEKVPFTLDLSFVVDTELAYLTGLVDVVVTSNDTDEGTAGVVFDDDVTFGLLGTASVEITLDKPFTSQTLTIEINSAATTVTIDVDVLATPSTMTIAGSASVVENTPFDLTITDAVDGDSVLLADPYQIEVLSSNVGEGQASDGIVVPKNQLTITAGGVLIEGAKLMLAPTTQTLTVNIYNENDVLVCEGEFPITVTAAE